MKYKPEIVLRYFNNMALPEPTLEFRFDLSRRWRFDFCWIPERVALEVEGGVWTGGRHGRGSGIVKDIEKYNAAALQGYTVLRCTPSNLCMKETTDMVRRALDLSIARVK